MIETLLKALGFKKIERIKGADKIIRVHEDGGIPVVPVEYSVESGVRFAREEKKINRIRDYFNSPESGEDNKNNDLEL